MGLLNILPLIMYIHNPIFGFSIAKRSCTSRSLGEVASSSSAQQAREHKRSAGRQLRGGDNDFDYEASLRRCSLCVRVSGLFCCRVRVRVTC